MPKRKKEEEEEEREVDIDKLLEDIDFDQIDTESKYELALKLYQEGYPTQEILEKLHISPYKFYEYLKEKGVELRRVKEAKKKIREKIREKIDRGTLPKDIVRALDSSYAGVVRKVMEQVDWFTTAIHEIGLGATFMAFQIAKVDPRDVFNKVMEFRDPEAFVDYVLGIFASIPEVLYDAMVLQEYKDKLSQYRAMFRIAVEKIKVLMQENRDLIFMLESLLSMTPSDVRNSWFEKMLKLEMLKSMTLFRRGGKGGEPGANSEEEVSGRAEHE